MKIKAYHALFIASAIFGLLSVIQPIRVVYFGFIATEMQSAYLAGLVLATVATLLIGAICKSEGY